MDDFDAVEGVTSTGDFAGESERSAPTEFLGNIARYFRDFLDTDFKRQRLPKRQLQRSDSGGNLTAIGLKKYQSLLRTLWKQLNDPIGTGFDITVTRGRYEAHISTHLSDLVTKYIDGIPADLFQRLHQRACELAHSIVETHIRDSEGCKATVISGLERDVIRLVVTPLIDHFESSLVGSESEIFEISFDIEDELGQRLIADAEESIGAALNTALVNQDFYEYDQLIADLLSENSIKRKLRGYFETYATSDLFRDLYELLSTMRIKENTELYLYIGDLKYKKVTYPLFYIPISLVASPGRFVLHIDPHLYINKKAIDYIAQERARTQNIQYRTLVADRIIYVDHDREMGKVLQDSVDAWVSGLGLRPALEFSTDLNRESTSSEIKLTNHLYLSVFDKSDEALINDYEELLNLIDTDSEIAMDFKSIVNAFLFSDPSNVSDSVETEWDEYPVEERLIYRAPIPLNEEQRRIQIALKKPQSRFVVVQGPPGTGKSHTITALAFDAILNDRSVLVLSDKKEALDVVEDKITQTLNNVRQEDGFQNPILRLGKSINTYNKIMSASSINKIKTQQVVAKAKKDERYRAVEEGEYQIRNLLQQDVESYKHICIPKIYDLIQIERELGDKAKKLVPLLLERESQTLLKCIRIIDDFLSADDRKAWRLLKGSAGKSSFRALQILSDVLVHIEEAPKPDPDALAGLGEFIEFGEEHVKVLGQLLQNYEEIRWPVFGFLLSRRRARHLDAEANHVLALRAYVDLHQRYANLRAAYSYIGNLRQFVMEQFGTLDQLKYSIQAILYGYEGTKEKAKKSQAALEEMLELQASLLDALNINLENIGSWAPSVGEGADSLIQAALDLAPKFTAISDAFANVPQYDYRKRMGQLESLHARALADTIDARVVAFYENKRAKAKSLRDIIKKKQRFPVQLFGDIKEAFPCIIANIRDYAEYMPLAPQLFDLIIIDEASQVSIAQAFPAILRAKQMVVFGDAKQFSNVKTATASKKINTQYLSEIRGQFQNEGITDSDIRNRVNKFDIKVSVLEFTEMLANYSALLKKHFRGYKEHISYSSKYFYDSQLQAIKIRGLPVTSVLEITFIDDEDKISVLGNVNESEADYIIDRVEDLLRWDDAPTVGVITPFKDQQRYIAQRIDNHPESTAIYERLRFKCMTFDSCQGEERDHVFYSMVANRVRDRLYAIFPKGSALSGDPEDTLRLQRLNVGFSRVKERMHFVLSKPIEEFRGAIGEALRHYREILDRADRIPTADEVDQKSPMELKLLEWLQQTAFYQTNYGKLEVSAQFPIGDYLKQLDPGYQHPAYRVDFLLTYTNDGKVHQIIIEYDGFKEHFTNLEKVDADNYAQYYKAEDIEREKILESYGYRILRVNRFNLGRDPVATLSERLSSMLGNEIEQNQAHAYVEDFNYVTKGIENGEVRECKRCEELKPLNKFRDKKTKTGYGRICKECKRKARQDKSKTKRDKNSRAEAAEGVSCPRCGGRMQVRKGPYGPFYGCSSFPRCRGTRRIPSSKDDSGSDD